MATTRKPACTNRVAATTASTGIQTTDF